jgi:hypothetical protein
MISSRLTKWTGRQHPAGGICPQQQDVDVPFDAPVLKPVVENKDIDFFFFQQL